jgi:predicted ribosome quality control (RQC) complex YloA/Tae2 family protein
MDVTSLKAVLVELRALLLPSRFEKAQQGHGQALQLAFRSLKGVHWLALSWQAEAPRLHAVPPPPRRGEGSTLAQQLQHGLRGLALVELRQSGWERVVELGFARRPGDPLERWLVLELMGRHSNLFLLDSQRQVVALARQVRPQQSRLRPIGTGDPYQDPPPLQAEPPSLEESAAAWQGRLQLQDLPLAQALQRSYQGVSPALVRQLLDGAPAPLEPASAAALTSTLTAAHWAALHSRWQQWLQAVAQQQFGWWRQGSHYRCWQPGGLPPGPGPSPGPELPASGATGAVNAGIAAYYADLLARRQFEQLRHQGLQRLQRLLQREQGQLQQQRQLLDATAGADPLQRQADALLCVADPSREQVDQAQKLYRQARRLRRSGTAIEQRLALHQQRCSWLEDGLTYLEQADSQETLELLLADLQTPFEAAGGSGRRSSSRPGRGGQGEPHQSHHLELCSPGGLRLQVGRNHRQNAWISLKQARRGDLWFHAQECPGSHVVLKGSEGLCAPEDLAAAAHLAAYFSRGRGNGRVPVVMVPIEALQRIPGAALGTVRHSGGTVLWGVPAEAGALLAAAPSLQAEPRP